MENFNFISKEIKQLKFQIYRLDKFGKGIFIKVYNWIVYAILPIIVVILLFNKTSKYGILDTNSYFLLIAFTIGVFKACSDTLSHHYKQSIFKNFNKQFFDAKISWKNKYIDFDYKKGRRTYFIYIPIIKIKAKKINIKKVNTRIPVAVMFTDGWHLFNSFQLASIVTTILCYVPINLPLWKVVILTVGSIQYGFNLFYNIILIRKQ